MNKNNVLNLFLFDEDIREKLSLISCMSSFVTSDYYPAVSDVWARHIAESLVDSGKETTVKKVSIENACVLKINTSMEELFNARTYKDVELETIIDAPMLVGNRFELEESLHEREIPKEIESIAERHRKRLLWIRKDKYSELYDSMGNGSVVSFFPNRVLADEQNVNSMNYILQYMPYRADA